MAIPRYFFTWMTFWSIVIFSCTNCEINEKIEESLNFFTKELYQLTKYNTSNQIISPFNLFTVMSAISLAITKETSSEVNNENNSMAHILSSLTAQVDSYKVIFSKNLLLLPQDFKWNARYLESVKNLVDILHLHDPKIINPEVMRINKFAENITNSLVEEIFREGSINKEKSLMAASTFYFKDAHLVSDRRHSFKTFIRPFRIKNTRVVKVQMMNAFGIFITGSFDDLEATAVLLPYQDYQLGLLCILPNRINGLRKLEHDLLHLNYTPSILLRKMVKRKANVTLPKFKIHSTIDASHIFRKIPDLFSNNINPQSENSVPRLSHFFHHSSMDIETIQSMENNVTDMDSLTEDNFVDFLADHPFLFYLIDRKSDNIPLMMGRLHNPWKSQDSLFNAKYSEFNSEKKSPMKTEFVNEIQAKHTGRLVKRQVTVGLSETEQPTGLKPESEEIQEKIWFNKPTAPEVIVPLATHQSDLDQKPTNPSTNLKNQTATDDFVSLPIFNPSFSGTKTPSNIFYSPTSAPNMIAFPVSSSVSTLTNIWNLNESSVFGAPPGFPPSNVIPNIPTPTSWYIQNNNPFLQSAPSFGSNPAGIFFPEFRFSIDRTTQDKKFQN